jgi:uncharacterized membrane protein
MVVTALLGWGTFTWRKAEEALVTAQKATDATDRLEVKLAENYVTKEELKTSVEMVMSEFGRTRDYIKDGFADIKEDGRQAREVLGVALHRLEDKVDYHVNEQAQESKMLRQKLEKRGEY